MPHYLETFLLVTAGQWNGWQRVVCPKCQHGERVGNPSQEHSPLFWLLHHLGSHLVSRLSLVSRNFYLSGLCTSFVFALIPPCSPPPTFSASSTLCVCKCACVCVCVLYLHLHVCIILECGICQRSTPESSPVVFSLLYWVRVSQ